MQTEERLWFTRNEAAALCGLSARQFDDVIRPRSKNATRGVGKSLRFDGPKVVAALVEYRLEKTAAPVDEMDPAYGGSSDSPALERGRLAKAKLLELDLAERQKSLVKIDLIRRAIMPGVAIMRKVGDMLTKKFGNEAGEIFNEGVSDFEASALRNLNEHADNRGDDPAANDGGDAIPSSAND